MRTQATLTIPGCPLNWSNERLSRFELNAQMQHWKRMAHMKGHGARAGAHWPLPIKVDPPAVRWVEFTLYRHTLLDDDGAWNSMKPVIDGLKGALLWDDGPAWCQVIARPTHPLGQVQIPATDRERTIIRVSLVCPVAKELSA